MNSAQYSVQFDSQHPFAVSGGAAALTGNGEKLLPRAVGEEVAVGMPVIAHPDLQIARDLIDERLARIKPLAALLPEAQ